MLEVLSTFQMARWTSVDAAVRMRGLQQILRTSGERLCTVIQSSTPARMFTFMTSASFVRFLSQQVNAALDFQLLASSTM